MRKRSFYIHQDNIKINRNVRKFYTLSELRDDSFYVIELKHLIQTATPNVCGFTKSYFRFLYRFKSKTV